MPREGLDPITVHNVTYRAVQETRDAFEEYAGYDAVVRDAMLQLDETNEHLSEEVREALEDGRMVVDEEELPDEEDEEVEEDG